MLGGAFFRGHSVYIHNDTPRSKSQNDFCSFRRVMWLLTQCSKLLSFIYIHTSYTLSYCWFLSRIENTRRVVSLDAASLVEDTCRLPIYTKHCCICRRVADLHGLGQWPQTRSSLMTSSCSGAQWRTGYESWQRWLAKAYVALLAS